MSFTPLFQINEYTVDSINDTEVVLKNKSGRVKTVQKPQPTKRAGLDLEKRGCKYCPMDKVPGIQKIKGTIAGKDILVIPQSPGPQENDEGKELLGPAGKLFWTEMKRVGLSRNDVDIQNVMRCFPADLTEGTYENYLKMRSPSKEELHCCSLYTERALEKSKARQILVLGQVAAKALFGNRVSSLGKTFWSDEHNARIYIVDHPAFFVRGYGSGPRMEAFRQTLKRLKDDHESLQGSDANLSDQFAYARKQHYRLVITEEEAVEADRIIRQAVSVTPIKGKSGRHGRRVSVDIEDDDFPVSDKANGSNHGEVDENRTGDAVETNKTVRRVIGVGICPRPGLSFFFVLNHPEIQGRDQSKVREIVKAILEDPEIAKVLHYGCSDKTKLKELEGINVKGFEHDTNLSEYIRFSDKKSYGLVSIVEHRFPQFVGWDNIVIPEMMSAHKLAWRSENPDVQNEPAIFSATIGAQAAYVYRKKIYHLRFCSLETLRIYNGVDCDVTKRIEIDNKKHVSASLMRLYIDLSFLLYKMEPIGPLFDYQQYQKLEILYPYLEKKLKHRLRKIVKNKKFNPASHVQVYKALYSTLGLEYPFDGEPNTQKMALLMMGRKHKFPRLLLEWRGYSRVVGTLKGYYRSAQANNNRLRTRWWATGTRTGRLSSGGEKNKKDSTLVNLQNIKRDPVMRNMCVADLRWERVYKFVGKLVGKLVESKPADLSTIYQRIEDWIREIIPDLKMYLLLDYGQVEVRVAAQLSGDENLLADCAKADIHTTVGVAMTGWDADRIANDEATRTLTKNVHFGILFGISKKNLFKFVLAMSPIDMRDRITEEEVGKSYDRYFARYTKIQPFIDAQREFGREHKYVTTAFGMRQALNVTNDDQDDEIEFVDDEVGGGQRDSWWGNQAINGPVQGTAHQLMICALVNLIRKSKHYRVLNIPVMEVHDALYFSITVLDLLEAYKKARYLLEHESLNTVKSDFPNIDWKAPIVVDTKGGLRLGDVVKISKDTSIGKFMVEWYQKAKSQQDALDEQLQEVTA